ncbi:hypothetical protein GGQ82_003302 [Sphingobium olei]
MASNWNLDAVPERHWRIGFLRLRRRISLGCTGARALDRRLRKSRRRGFGTRSDSDLRSGSTEIGSAPSCSWMAMARRTGRWGAGSFGRWSGRGMRCSMRTERSPFRGARRCRSASSLPFFKRQGEQEGREGTARLKPCLQERPGLASAQALGWRHGQRLTSMLAGKVGSPCSAVEALELAHGPCPSFLSAMRQEGSGHAR